MENLRVTPEYLNELAAKQEEASAGFATADSKAAGLADAVAETHGSICGASTEALRAAETALHDLAEAMKSCAEALAERVREAAKEYHSTDSGAF